MLTIFIGGNHEASSYLFDLPYGGWVAPNIYYMGYSNVIKIGDLRIGGISGILKKYDYRKGRYETYPFSESSIRSIFHYREYDFMKLAMVKFDDNPAVRRRARHYAEP